MQRVGLSDPEPSPGIRPVKALDAGTVLGSYEVLEPIGAGGMGGIARVTASKVATWRSRYLPEGFSQDEARRKRFEREARVLPSLNHENIGAIYGLEQDGRIAICILPPRGHVAMKKATIGRGCFSDTRALMSDWNETAASNR